MFRHKNTVDLKEENKKTVVIKDASLVGATAISTPKVVTPKTDTEMIKELLEKNLKWSQIIYEQNRKINNKLMWSAIFSWFRVLLILVPLILAAWFLPPLLKNLQNTYGGLLGGKTVSVEPNTKSIDQLMKLLPLDPAKQEQLKALLK